MPTSLALALPETVAVPVVVTGGQAAAHAPEQEDWFMASFANSYTVRPEPSVRNVPADPELVLITVAEPAAPAGEAAAAELAAAPPLAGLLLLALLPHAAAASSAAVSGTPSLTAAGNRLTNELLIVIVSCPGRR